MLIEILLSIVVGVFFGMICGVIPGIHPNLVAILLLSVSPFLLQYFSPLVLGIFIVSVNVTNTFVNALPSIFLGATLVVGGMATILSLKLSKIFSKLMTKVNYSLLCLSIILMIVILVFVLTGFLGMLVLITATALGLIPTLRNIGKNHLMGCLLFPVILFFLL